MGEILDVELQDPPDGKGWWPEVFGISREWLEERGTSWAAVTKNPNIQAKRPSSTSFHARLKTGDVSPVVYTIIDEGYEDYLIAIKEE